MRIDHGPLLPALEIIIGGTPRHSVIWLHGLGADGNDFAPIVPELALPADAGIRFIFPHAPSRPVTVNGGMVMPAWYDILEISLERRVDLLQLRHSASRVIALLEREIARGIPAQRIALAGFSQGGAVAIEVALTCGRELAGLIALSTYFATAASTPAQPMAHALPIFIGHGTLDPIVPLSLGQRCRDDLVARRLVVEYHTYPMEHAVCPREIADIAAWLRRWLLREPASV